MHLLATNDYPHINTTPDISLYRHSHADLIQRTSGGMGSALGGGAADQVLAGSAAQLTKLTVWGILGFFILSLSLYALYQNEAGERTAPIRAGHPKLRPTPIHLHQAILRSLLRT